MTRLKMNDYIRRWDKDKKKWIYLHREVMEREINRSLTSNEHIHHIDGDVTNNAIENLQILSRAEHASISKNKRSLHPHCDINGCKKIHHARGLCKTHYRLKYPEKHYGKHYVNSEDKKAIMQGANPCLPQPKKET
jgi:hypothetical protein